MHPGKLTGGLGIGSIGLDQADGINAVGLAHFKVFHPVIRGRMDGAGTSIG